MHEQRLMTDLVAEVARIASFERARPVCVRVRLGALSHFTPQHFREHWEDATRGTPFEGCAVETHEDGDPTAHAAQTVVLESIDLAD
jgi:hydrogenase nickel incorporation protein HypA/HybF